MVIYSVYVIYKLYIYTYTCIRVYIELVCTVLEFALRGLGTPCASFRAPPPRGLVVKRTNGGRLCATSCSVP